MCIRLLKYGLKENTANEVSMVGANCMFTGTQKI